MPQEDCPSDELCKIDPDDGTCIYSDFVAEEAAVDASLVLPNIQ